MTNREEYGHFASIMIIQDIMAMDFKYEIVEHIGVLSTSAKGWNKELNRVSWNGGAAKLDLRDWAPDHAKMGKGATLTEEEARKLKELLDGLFE